MAFTDDEGFTTGRIQLAARTLGVARAALEDARGYASAAGKVRPAEVEPDLAHD
jgi:alkylation response protein AidB-like acyl-CoA dehydrogenase